MRVPVYGAVDGGPSVMLGNADGRVIFNCFADTTSQQLMIPVTRVPCVTMKGRDVAVLELGARYADLAARGVRAWTIAPVDMHRGEPLAVVGAPLQRDPARS